MFEQQCVVCIWVMFEQHNTESYISIYYLYIFVFDISAVLRQFVFSLLKAHSTFSILHTYLAFYKLIWNYWFILFKYHLIMPM